MSISPATWRNPLQWNSPVCSPQCARRSPEQNKERLVLAAIHFFAARSAFFSALHIFAAICFIFATVCLVFATIHGLTFAAIGIGRAAFSIVRATIRFHLSAMTGILSEHTGVQKCREYQNHKYHKTCLHIFSSGPFLASRMPR